MKNLRSLNYFLRLEVSSDDDCYYLSQADYASYFLSRSGLMDTVVSQLSLK